ncbi:uncharacterized protein PV07_02427 [Cladophialophora immunda]|uniref:Uncharacterized protein n=1 Tax=Cladophialophora immunda TaxID=569365 RepID=A0A0D1ZRP1_9EURO|nr:uncharacterized protein PV07_02427 [Cladophialophora immunda]KIW30721.1 hypothetical protein PV07_02427 [Cladophialophora immunda]
MHALSDGQCSWELGEKDGDKAACVRPSSSATGWEASAATFSQLWCPTSKSLLQLACPQILAEHEVPHTTFMSESSPLRPRRLDCCSYGTTTVLRARQTVRSSLHESPQTAGIEPWATAAVSARARNVLDTSLAIGICVGRLRWGVMDGKEVEALVARGLLCCPAIINPNTTLICLGQD